jgi:hypothetical protein
MALETWQAGVIRRSANRLMTTLARFDPTMIGVSYRRRRISAM